MTNRFTQNLWSWTCLFLVIGIADSGIAQNESPLPLDLLPGEYLAYEGDERLEIEREATIEVSLKLYEDSGEKAVILSHGHGDLFNYRLTASYEGDHVGAVFGKTSGQAVTVSTEKLEPGEMPAKPIIDPQADRATEGRGSCQWRDGKFHTVVVTCKAGVCQLWVDGKPSGWPFYGELANAVLGGRPLYLGSDGMAPEFDGEIRRVRFWNRALNPDEIAGLDETATPETEGMPLHDAWTGSARFTTDRTDLYFHSTKLEPTLLRGRLSDDARLALLPEGYSLQGIWIAEKDGISDLRLEATSPSGFPLLLPESAWPQGREERQAITAKYAALDAALKSGEEQLVKDTRGEIVNLFMGIKGDDETESPWIKIEIPEGGYQGFAATVDDRLMTLSICQSGQLGLEADSEVTDINGSQHAQAISIQWPRWSRFGGLECHYDDGDLVGIRALYRHQPSASKDQYSYLESARWRERDAREPVPGASKMPAAPAPAVSEDEAEETFLPKWKYKYMMGDLVFLSEGDRKEKLKERQILDKIDAVSRMLVDTLEWNQNRGEFKKDPETFQKENPDFETDPKKVSVDEGVAAQFIRDFNWLNYEDSNWEEGLEPESEVTVDLSALVPALTLACEELNVLLRPPDRWVPFKGEVPGSLGPKTKRLAASIRKLWEVAKLYEPGPLLHLQYPDDDLKYYNAVLSNALDGVGRDETSWKTAVQLPEPGTGGKWSPPKKYSEALPEKKERVAPGSFKTVPYGRVRFAEDGSSVVLSSDFGIVHRLAKKRPGVFGDDKGVVLELDVDEHALWTNARLDQPERSKDRKLASLNKLEIPTPYPVGGSDDKVDWGGTFALADRPPLCRANFTGYNLRLMHPIDHQNDNGADHLIFRYPAEDSKDYYTTDSKVIVPYGLRFVSVNEGTEGVETDVVRTSDERSSTWSAHLGAKVGYGGALGGASISMNAKWGGENSYLSSKGTTRTISRSVETRYALVLDKGRMQFSDDFLERINEMRDFQLAMGLVPDPVLKSFIKAFGTHYPYAVTYGGMAVMEMDFDESKIRNEDGSFMDVSASAEASYLGVTGGVSGGYAQSNKDAQSKEVSHERIKFDTYGGSLSRGEGWSLSKGEEVPVYLDLRPIDELLNPVFFDDPVIYTGVKACVKNAIKRYLEKKENVSF